MFAPYCAQMNDVQGRCLMQNFPTFWSSINRHSADPTLLPVNRYNVAQWQPCFTPKSIMQTTGYIDQF